MDSEIIKAQEALRQADAILIGASNGLSISEGYNIFADNEIFGEQFGDFREKYGVRSVLDGIFTREMSPEDHRKYLERLVDLWVTRYQVSPVMKDLREIVGDKPYFVLTTNADEHLEAAGFSPDKVWEIEGTFRDSLDGRSPENKQAALDDFLNKYADKRLVILELGIGSRNRIIKLPLMQLTAQLPDVTYITLNLPHEIFIPRENADKSIALPGDIAETLQKLTHPEG